MKIYISESIDELPKIPDIVYHGQAPKYEYIGNGKTKSSLEKFEQFSNNYKRFLQKTNVGFYFTPQKALAQAYAEGGYIYTCELDIKNPYYYLNRYNYSGEGLIKNPSFITQDDIKKVTKMGYDGIASLDIVGNIMEIVVFDPSRVKILNVERDR